MANATDFAGENNHIVQQREKKIKQYYSVDTLWKSTCVKYRPLSIEKGKKEHPVLAWWIEEHGVQF